MLKLLSRQHLFILEKTTVVLAKLLSWDHYIPPAPNPNLEERQPRDGRETAERRPRDGREIAER